jgi:tetratricopeptide (TPR) repeat protein
MYWSGHALYFQKRYEEALVRLTAAVKLDDDARSWYFKGLTERALGEDEEAQKSLRRAAELHLAGKPRADLIDTSLRQVRGEERRLLTEALAAQRATKK